MGFHNDQASLNLLRHFEYPLRGCAFLQSVLHMNIFTGRLHFLEYLPHPCIVFSGVASSLDLVMIDWRRHHMKDDDAGPAIPSQGAGQEEGLLRVLGKIGREENRVNR